MPRTESPSLIENLVAAFRTIPGVGPKTAQRYIFHLLQHDRSAAKVLAQTLLRATNEVSNCERCNTLSELPVCSVCADNNRDPSLLCVVENPVDQASVEATLGYRGLYFVLMGRLAPLEEIGPNELGFSQLLERAGDGVVKEVILATSFTREGEATAHYLGQYLRTKGVKVTRLARGIPMGSELEYVDAFAIAQALRERR